MGDDAALRAAAVAATFEIINRVVDRTGLPVCGHRIETDKELNEALGLEARFLTPAGDHLSRA